MKKILFVLLVMMLSTVLFANTAINSQFDGKLTVMTQYMKGYNNVQLSWEDSPNTNKYYAYIITSGNSSNEDEFMVKGYTTDTKYTIKRNIPHPTLPTYYTVYKVTFAQYYDLAEIIPNDNSANHFKAALTWSQIKELLKRKSNNIWKINRSNIPADLR